MNCCGEERKTAFCPDCGKALQQGPIAEILAFVKGRRSQLEGSRRRFEQWDKEHADKADDNWRLRKRAQIKVKMERYERWILALENIMAQKKASEGD